MVFVLPLLFIAVSAWFYPRASGIAAVTWSITSLIVILVTLDIGQIFYPLWFIFFIGGAMHLFIPGEKDISISAEEKFRWSAIIVSFLSLLCYLIIFLLVIILRLPAGLGTGLFYTFVVIIIAILALYKPLIGGTMLLFSGSILFLTALIKDHYPQYYVPLSSFSSIGGLLHLISRGK